jgi:poly(beta-D-mannuronate) lyase
MVMVAACAQAQLQLSFANVRSLVVSETPTDYRKSVQGLLTSFVCPTPIPYPTNFDPPSFYDEGGRQDTYSEENYKAYQEATLPLLRFRKQLTTVADNYIMLIAYGFSSEAEKIAACALELQYKWAAGNALVAPITGRQGRYERDWFTTGQSVLYSQIKWSSGLSSTKKTTVEKWLKALSYATKNDATGVSRPQFPVWTNNHLYWAGLNAVSTGATVNDNALFQWGMAAYYAAVKEITNEGTLPKEMARGTKALHYMNYATIPLVYMAEIASMNGVDLWSTSNNRLQLVIDRVLTGLEDPTWFNQKTGFTQDTSKIWGEPLAWMEPYYRRTHDARVEKYLRKYRPFYATNPMGTASLLWGERGSFQSN